MFCVTLLVLSQSEESIDPIRDIKIVNDELIEKVCVELFNLISAVHPWITLVVQDIELCQFAISTQEYAFNQGKLGAEGKHEYLTLIKIYETLSGKIYVKKGKVGGETYRHKVSNTHPISLFFPRQVGLKSLCPPIRHPRRKTRRPR